MPEATRHQRIFAWLLNGPLFRPLVYTGLIFTPINWCLAGLHKRMSPKAHRAGTGYARNMVFALYAGLIVWLVILVAVVLFLGRLLAYY
jgi:hypothetical protein